MCLFYIYFDREEISHMEEQRKWLDQEMEMVLQQRHAVEELEKVMTAFRVYCLHSLWQYSVLVFPESL